MDPDVALLQIRTLCEQVQESECKDDFDEPTVALELVDAVTALDGWLSDGGFLPSAWSKARSRGGEHGDEGDRPVRVRHGVRDDQR